MYFLPIAMVMGLKRLLRTSWPIRAPRASVEDDPACRHRADFKWDIYLIVFASSFGVACLPLLAYDALIAPASMYFALAPAATATCLAVLIDVDVVDWGNAPARRRPRTWVLTARAIGLAGLLGGLISWLAAELTEAPVASLVVYAVTAAFMGIMIGIRSDFDRNVRVV
jgi:hypothetical protein